MNIINYVNQSLYGDFNKELITRSILCISLLECNKSINPDIIIHMENKDIDKMYDLILKEDTCDIIENACKNDFSELFCLLCRNKEILERFNKNPKSAMIMICAPDEFQVIYLYYYKRLI